MQCLAGIGGFKKATQGTATPFSAFCGKKLGEENEGEFPATVVRSPNNIIYVGKEQGSRTTLPEFLKEHANKLSAEYSILSPSEKEALLANYLEAKEEKNTTKRLSNISVSKAVDSKLQRITSIVCTYHIFSTILTFHNNSVRTSTGCTRLRLWCFSAVVKLPILTPLAHLQRRELGNG